MIVEPDSPTRAALSSGPVEPLGPRHLLPLAVLLVVGGLTLLPTVVGVRDGAGLDTLPLVDLAGGGHEPRWLPAQPSDVALRSLFVAALVAPFAAVGGALVSAPTWSGRSVLVARGAPCCPRRSSWRSASQCSPSSSPSPP